MSYMDGSCLVCGQGTDTALGVEGEAEWHIAAVQMLGVPSEEAATIISNVTGNPEGMVPDGRYGSKIRVCTGCVAKSVFHPRIAPALYVDGGTMPTITQP